MRGWSREVRDHGHFVVFCEIKGGLESATRALRQRAHWAFWVNLEGTADVGVLTRRSLPTGAAPWRVRAHGPLRGGSRGLESASVRWTRRVPGWFSVYGQGLERLLGAKAWREGMERRLGATVWGEGLGRTLGARAWGEGLGRRHGAKAWREDLERRFGAKAWSEDKKQKLEALASAKVSF